MPGRDHHLQMKYLLARMALENPDRFFATFGPGGDPAFLPDLWAGMGQSLPAGEQVPALGMAAWHRPAGAGPEVVVLTLPAPAASNEAYFVAAVRPAGAGCRVFFLERATLPSTGETFTMLAELSPAGRSNWGAGGPPAVDNFVDQLGLVVANPSARPMTFIPMGQG